MVVPPLKAMTSPGVTSETALAPMALFSPGWRTVRYRMGRSPEMLLTIAPPRVRVTSCWSARASRSRRAVAGETSKVSTICSTWADPLATM